MDHQMRRKDRDAGQEQAWRVLNDGHYGVLSTVSADGQPYGVPLHYCLMDRAIYFHCALEGHKLDNLAHNGRVSFCVVGMARVMPEKFATLYESAVVLGTAAEIFGAEKQKALEALVDKYSPDYRAQGLEYIEKLKSRARVFKLTPEKLTCKARLS